MNYTPTSVKQLEEAFAANPNAPFKLKIYSGTFGCLGYAFMLAPQGGPSSGSTPTHASSPFPQSPS